jgi:hypothetical protein
MTGDPKLQIAAFAEEETRNKAAKPRRKISRKFQDTGF